MQSDAINLLITNKVFKKAINLNMEQYDDPTILARFLMNGS